MRFSRTRIARPRTWLSALTVLVLAIGGVSSASMASAAGPKMTWTIAPTSTEILSGGTVSYTINIECSNLDTATCDDPTLTVAAPHSSDGSVVATDPTISASGVDVTANVDGSVTLALDAMKPGQSRQLLLTWSVPNFTVLPDTELDSTGSLAYSSSTAGEVTGVAPQGDVDSVFTTAEPALTVTKTMVDPSSADKVRPGDTATYRLTACLPGDALGQLDYTHVHMVDTLDVSPVEPAGSEAAFRNVDGGEVSADGRSVTWDVDITADNRPLCGTSAAIVKEISVYYPAGMEPVPTGDGTVDNRIVTNNLDAEATLITNEKISQHAELVHAFSNASSAGTIHLQPNQETPNPTGIVKGDQAATFHWGDNLNWMIAGQEPRTDQRATAIFDSLPCMTNIQNGVPTNLSLGQSGNGGANQVHNVFQDDAEYTAPTLTQQCTDPAFKTTAVRISVPKTGSGARDEIRVTVYYWDSATSTSGSKVVTLRDMAVGEERSIPVYDASGFGLSSTQTITDVLGVTSPSTATTSRWNLYLDGVQSDSFAASDYMAMTNHFISYLSSVSTDGTLSTVQDELVNDSVPASKVKSFIKEVRVPLVQKSSDDDLTTLKPGDTVDWTINVGNSGLSEGTITPALYDVLPVGLSYVEGSSVWSNLGDHAAPAERVETVTIDGVEHQKITWLFSDEFDPGETATVSFQTDVTIEASSGSHSKADAQFAAVLDQDGDITENLSSADTWDLDGDGNTTERVQTSTVDWTVTAESGATIEKFVKGSAGDGEWKTEDVSIAALADDGSAETTGTDVDYRIRISNESANTLKDIVAYDVLPYVGDTGIGESLQGDSRGSEFQVDFQKLLSELPAGVSVQYSTSENPTRPELFPNGQPSGAVDDWTSTLPADPSTVRALKFTIESLDPGDERVIDYRGVVPTFVWNETGQVCQADPAEKAWNNVAIQATAALPDGTERVLLPAEAPRVSIREVCGQIGDYAWFDTNRDGVQDADEKPAAGVTFQLLDGEGQPVLDADGNTITAVTDENGAYHFDVPVGDWSVQVIDVPDDTVLTTADAGGDDAKDSDAPGLNQPTAPVSITPDHLVDTTLDAGLVGTVSVGDYVWLDSDHDGIQDDGEKGIAGVELTLTGPDGQPVTDVNGDPVQPVVTDANGAYSFDDLPALPEGQSYTVTVSKTPEGYAPTKPGQGDDPAKDSSTGSAASTGLNEPGQRDSTLDFGFVPVVSVGDKVWVDTDRDGIQDAGEPGIPGVELTLVGPDGNPVTDVYGNPVAPVTTDENGEYSFDNLPDLPAGEHYTVKITPPDGYLPTTPNAGDDRSKDSSTGESESTDLTEPGQRDDTLDFGFVPAVSVGDFVWYDADRDGVQDEGEKGIAGVELTLTGPDGQPVTDVNGDPVQPVVTDANGAYSFDGLPVLKDGESYTVTVSKVPAGYAPTTPGQGGDRAKDSSTGSASSEGLTGPGERDSTLDFGFVGSVSVGDYVWSDTDRDGVQDAGEPGIAGVELTLTGPDGQPVTDVYGNPVAPVVTDANGAYSFDDLPVLPEGQSYTVTVSKAPEGYGPTKPGQGGDPAKDSSTGSAASTGLNEPGQRDSTLDFGFVPAVSVGDKVWVDTDRDGIQDAGEPGIPGVELTLTGPDGQPVTDIYGNPVLPVLTDENGEYSFDDLPALQDGQSYTVTVSKAPEGYTPTKSGQGGRDVDSSTGSASSEGLTKPGERDSTLDFGFFPAVSVGDFVWIDTDGDGIQDAGEPGIPGVVLTIYGPDGQPARDVNGDLVPPVTTDENGHYLFENLPALEEGQSYTVKIDRDATEKSNPGFASFIPTISGAGSRDVDSSEWEASSQGLTTPGSSDLTLDFGFVPTAPVIDIEKFDADGNDADTSDESVALPDGTTELTFRVTNLGNEDLVNVQVSDLVVDGSGTVSDLVCALPDGTTGTTFSGPLAPGASFECTATLTGVQAGEAHLDTATVTADGRWTGTPVTDHDDYNAHTPNPGIDIEKVDVDGNDADTVADTVKIQGTSQKIVLKVTNTGDEALKGVTVSDRITAGAASVDGLTCALPDGSSGLAYSGVLEPGASFECTATVSGLVDNDQHTDIASVTGTGVSSGKKVGDDDAYNVIRIPGLAITGGQIQVVGIALAVALIAGGGLLLLLRRRRAARIEEA